MVQKQERKKTDVASVGKCLQVFYLYKAGSVSKVYCNVNFLLIVPFILFVYFLVVCNICTGGMMEEIIQELDAIRGTSLCAITLETRSHKDVFSLISF